MDFFAIANEEVDFSNYSLMAPAVSVGNVGQLSCDLLINSLKLKKIGYLQSKCVLPVIGTNAFQIEDSLTLSLELFSDSKTKIAVLQQRSPIVAGKQKEFTQDLLSWINKSGFSDVTLLASCHAYERMDDEISGSPVRFLAQSEDKKIELQGLNFLELQKRLMETGEKKFFLPGGGCAKCFHDEYISSGCKFSSAVLVVFCSEGDNIPEAVLLANALNTWKKFIILGESRDKTVWTPPASWKHLFGARQPLSIF